MNFLNESNKFDNNPDKHTTLYMLQNIVTESNYHVNSIREVDKPLVLYGAGTLGKIALEYFNNIGIPISCIIDKKINYDINNFVNDNIRENYLLAICIVTSSYEEIYSQLISEGWKDIIPFYDITLAYQDIHPLNNGWYAGIFNNKDIEGMEYVIDHLGDDISYAHYLQFVAWHSLRKEYIFKDAPIIHKDKYFIPEVVSILNRNETFVDIGAYDGEFTIKFMKNVNNKFEHIYAFEPDKENIDRFVRNVGTHDKIKIIPNVLGKRSEKRKFYSKLKCLSQLSELGSELVQVHILDDFEILPTIIKIHVEGLENDIIKGGLKTIIDNRPILMITIYHDRKGLWENIYYLMKLLDNYVYYFRLHAWCGTSGIIYAIPEGRML